MYSDPVVGERFFARDEVLALLNKRASALREGYRQNIALTGPSLSGKSSIILHFLRFIEEEGFVPVYIEVIKESFSSFARKFIGTMLYNALSKIGRIPAEDLHELLDAARTHLPNTHKNACVVLKHIEMGENEEAYSALLALTSTLKAEISAPCIVILDEFDNLEHLGIRNPFLGFGKMIMVQKDTMYIVSSSRDNAIRKILSEKLSLLFGNFEVVRISNFDSATAGRFIDSKMSLFDLAPDAKKFLIAFCDGNPFYLDKLVSRSRQLALESMTNFIDESIIVEAIVDLVYAINGTIYQYLHGILLDLIPTDRRDIGTSVLSAIASGRNRYNEIASVVKGKKRDVSACLEELCDSALITKNGVFYALTDSMFKYWLNHVYARRRTMLVRTDIKRRFADDVRAYFKLCTSELRTDPVSRIISLFDRFGNEVLQVDSKEMRLPRFTKVETVQHPHNDSLWILASFRGKFWTAKIYDGKVTENDVLEYIREAKSLDLKISNKVIIALAGIDENASLLAKELRMNIWDASALNMLMDFYGIRKMVAA